jgi:hypothetical protein
MLAGDAVLFDEILTGIEKEDSFDDIQKRIQKNMVKIKEKHIGERCFNRYKIDFSFIHEALKIPELNVEMKEIMDYVNSYTLQTTVLLSGFVGEKAQIVEIDEICATNARDINFNAIGSGGIQAINTLLFQGHMKTDTLPTTIYNVFKAKRNSEGADGVGRMTELFLLDTSGNLSHITEEQLQLLDGIYDEEIKFGKENPKLDIIVEGIGV